MGLGQRISERIEALEINQSELARRANLPQTTINSIIRRNGRSSPHLVRIAKALRTSAAYLTGATDDPEGDLAGSDLAYEEQVLLDLFRELGSGNRKLVLQLTRSLAECGRPPTLHDRQLEYRAG